MIYSLILGISAGVISGLIPGVGNLVTILILFPLLIDLNPIDLIVFYVALSSISQYIGSVPAIALGVPGESSSLPAVIERKNLNSTQQINDAIVGSALGSLYGSVLVVACCWALQDYILWLIKFYSTPLMVVLLTVCMLLICKTSSGSFVKNLMFLFVGFFLASIGHNTYLNTNILTFGQPELFNGLPLVVVSVMLFAIPQIYQSWAGSTLKHSLHLSRAKQLPSLLNSSLYSVIGFVGGLMPGMTTVFSSNLAYSTSKLFKQSPLKRIWASETANNAGAFSQLLPLLAFGIPLLGSEALILNLMELKGFYFSVSNFSDMLITVSLILIPVNIIGLLLAWPFSRTILSVFVLGQKKIYIIVLVLLGVAIVYSGIRDYALGFYLLATVALAPLAYLVRNQDTLSLIFGFLIANLYFENVSRLTQLW